MDRHIRNPQNANSIVEYLTTIDPNQSYPGLCIGVFGSETPARDNGNGYVVFSVTYPNGQTIDTLIPLSQIDEMEEETKAIVLEYEGIPKVSVPVTCGQQSCIAVIMMTMGLHLTLSFVCSMTMNPGAHHDFYACVWKLLFSEAFSMHPYMEELLMLNNRSIVDVCLTNYRTLVQLFGPEKTEDMIGTALGAIPVLRGSAERDLMHDRLQFIGAAMPECIDEDSTMTSAPGVFFYMYNHRKHVIMKKDALILMLLAICVPEDFPVIFRELSTHVSSFILDQSRTMTT